MQKATFPPTKRQGELDNVFERLGLYGAQKVEDEVNSQPNLGQDLDRNLAIALAYQGEEGPKASAVGNLSQQDFLLIDPRDEKLAALTRTIQALLERVYNRRGLFDTTFDLIVPISPLGQ